MRRSVKVMGRHAAKVCWHEGRSAHIDPEGSTKKLERRNQQHAFAQAKAKPESRGNRKWLKSRRWRLVVILISVALSITLIA